MKDNKFKSGVGSASVIIVIVIALLVVLGGIYFYKKGHISQNYNTNPVTNALPTNPGSNYQSSPPAATNSTGLTSGNSDANINQDLQTVGNNLNTLDSQSANVDSSMSQQQVDPTQ